MLIAKACISNSMGVQYIGAYGTGILHIWNANWYIQVLEQHMLNQIRQDPGLFSSYQVRMGHKASPKGPATGPLSLQLFRVRS